MPSAACCRDGTCPIMHDKKHIPLHDAEGIMRQTLHNAGGMIATTSYDPWGVPTTGRPPAATTP